MPRTKAEKTTTKKAATKPTAKATKTTKKTAKKEIALPEFQEIDNTPSNSPLRKLLTPKFIIGALIVIGIFILAYLNKGLFVAATVNNQPITTFEVNKRMDKLYKERIVNQMVNEALIEQEATKKGVSVSRDEIAQRVSQQAEQYGGEETFNSLLAQQGLTREEFERQTRLQLVVEKIYSNEIEPTQEEINQFLEENKDSPEATDSAKFTETAKEEIKQQKLSTVFSEKFQELKNSAKIQTF